MLNREQETPRVRALRLWRDTTGSAQDPTNPSRQKDWDNALCTKKFAVMQATSTSPLDLARLHAVSSPLSGSWLNALPIANLGLKLDDSQLRIACGLRLGANLCAPHSCSACGSEVSSLGTHGLSCKKSAGRHARHSQVNDLIRRACVSAGAPAILEPPGIVRSDGKRPDGVTLIPWRLGRQLVWDFTCKDTLAPSHVTMSASGPGKVATEGERAKNAKYQELSQSYLFTPVCVETLGAWGPSATSLVKELGARIQATTGEPRSTCFLTQAISMAVQRGNIISILGTMPYGKCLEEIFELL